MKANFLLVAKSEHNRSGSNAKQINVVCITF